MIRQMLNWNTDVVLAYNETAMSSGGIRTTKLQINNK